MANTDILEMLAILKKLNIRDKCMVPAIEVLRSKRLDDSFWLNENSKEGRMAVTIDQQGHPSPWITRSAVDVPDWWKCHRWAIILNYLVKLCIKDFLEQDDYYENYCDYR